MELEETLFLYINKRFWDIDAISKFVEQKWKIIANIFLWNSKRQILFLPNGL